MDAKITKTQRDILKMMMSGYSLKCWGNPSDTRSAWLTGNGKLVAREVSRRTLRSLLSNDLVKIEKLGSGRWYGDGHTILDITDKGTEAVN